MRSTGTKAAARLAGQPAPRLPAGRRLRSPGACRGRTLDPCRPARRPPAPPLDNAPLAPAGSHAHEQLSGSPDCNGRLAPGGRLRYRQAAGSPPLRSTRHHAMPTGAAVAAALRAISREMSRRAPTCFSPQTGATIIRGADSAPVKGAPSALASATMPRS